MNLPAQTEIMQVPITRPQIDAINGVVYNQIKNTRSIRQMRMSLLVPRTDALKPAIICFPGGGFTSADYEKFIEMRMALAEAGFVVAATEYRVVPNTFPAPLQDGKAAVRYLRAHAAEYGIDPGRIGVLGDSAGGWMAQMMGVTNQQSQFDQGDFLEQPSHVQAVVSIYGISNLLNIGEGFGENAQAVHQSPAVTEALLVHGVAFHTFAGATIGSNPEKALAASPMGYLGGDKPPFLLMHGDRDTLVSPQQSIQMYEALQQNHADAELVILEGADHGGLHWFQPPLFERVVRWFTEKLSAPEATNPAVADNFNARL
ncbi:MAG: alpha/beta hydrolase [Neisseria sp.]|nr:alpha/beta hydrolase [Neisseria sp.]